MAVAIRIVMVDSTGMCGACRVTVDVEVQFVCVDGLLFNVYGIDFYELIKKNKFYPDGEIF